MSYYSFLVFLYLETISAMTAAKKIPTIKPTMKSISIPPSSVGAVDVPVVSGDAADPGIPVVPAGSAVVTGAVVTGGVVSSSTICLLTRTTLSLSLFIFPRYPSGA